MRKKSVCIITALCMLFSCCSTAFAQGSTARLYTAYGDGMLFKQNETVTFKGVAQSGSRITAELYGDDGNMLKSGEATATQGAFTVSFDGMPGSYNTYTVVLKENGVEFDTLENVVFGELWLASGQSNMMYPLGQSKDGVTMQAQGTKCSEWLRVYMEPAYPTYNGSDSLIPCEPQAEIIGGHWITGGSAEIYSMSAVGYFFAQKLMEELNMPVGVLNSSLGGSSIISWISRDAIDSDEWLKNTLKESGEYVEKSDWNESEADIYSTMSANYNLRTYAYRAFKLSGMIWYQGESDLIAKRSSERYANELDLMQRSYTELFGYTDGLLPLVYTQLAPYYYPDDEFVLPQRNYVFSLIQQAEPDSRAAVTLYDVPVTFLPEVGVIHPEHKTEVGERMAFAAMGLVYGTRSTYTAAAPSKTEVADGSIYITLNNVGDGLKAKDSEIKGFTVCGEDGIHIQAKAEIVSGDTVKVWHESVAEPKAATYAYCVSNGRANLYATENGELALPVSPFDTDENVSTRYWRDPMWADCDTESAWHNHGDKYSAYYPTWASDSAEIVFSENMLNIKSSENEISLSPVVGVESSAVTTEYFNDCEADYSAYGTLSFYVRNNGSTDVTFDQLRLYVQNCEFAWYSPAVDGTKDVSTAIPADGDWHKITLDLNRVYLFGNECTAAYSNKKLSNVGNISFCFTCADGNADISLDSIEFTASTQQPQTRFDAQIANADNVFEYICGCFTAIIGAVINLFSK